MTIGGNTALARIIHNDHENPSELGGPWIGLSASRTKPSGGRKYVDNAVLDEIAGVARQLLNLAGSTREAPASPDSALPTTLVARALIKDRRDREIFFRGSLFADPAWDILLDLFCAAEEGRRISVSSLCVAAAVPPTTALRYIKAMAEEGLLIRKQDHLDARRIYVELSLVTMANMQHYMSQIAGRWSLRALPGL